MPTFADVAYGVHMEIPAASAGSAIHHGMFGIKMKGGSGEVGHNKVYLCVKKHIEYNVCLHGCDYLGKLLLTE